ncbi:MAG: hypothetical protein EG828_04965 [Deltaproteobacteria bacterium]|nr:hypothetical protein [Deltaproteobacteria bacterium]
MSITNSADFSSFKTRLTPPALACFRVLFENAREMLAKQGPQQSYEVPLANLISLDEVADVESVAESIREIIQCRVQQKVGEYMYFYPFFASVSIESGAIRYRVHQELEESISLLPALFVV